jgi:hypothetical protein
MFKLSTNWMSNREHEFKFNTLAHSCKIIGLRLLFLCPLNVPLPPLRLHVQMFQNNDSVKQRYLGFNVRTVFASKGLCIRVMVHCQWNGSRWMGGNDSRILVMTGPFRSFSTPIQRTRREMWWCSNWMLCPAAGTQMEGAKELAQKYQPTRCCLLHTKWLTQRMVYINRVEVLASS